MIGSLPFSIVQALYDLLLQERPVAYLEVDFDGQLISQGGHNQLFGFEHLHRGDLVEDQIDFLVGAFARDYLPFDLPYMLAPSGIAIDVHIFEKEERIWVLIVHAEEKKHHQQLIQQKVNDLSLIDYRRSRIMNQYLGKEVVDRLDEGIENIQSTGERRELTIMFADIRGFTSFSEKSPPEEVFDVLNIYLGAMIPAVLDANGVVDKIIGDEVMAIFGMLPDEQDSAAQGFNAALNMLHRVDLLNQQRRQQQLTCLHIGIGIASGPVSLGILGSEHRKSITVVGNHVNLAARLQGQADANQMIIDKTTYELLTDQQGQFNDCALSLKGYPQRQQAYLLNYIPVQAEPVM